ncbi:tail fiber protein [Kosakonia sacchari]|uniref:tail fiber protein n=1 Tax=Kosakonia sacchari TaxID=1158459 RepID=UPI002ACE8CEA|nr:tail fiber protein [Kosakonia sacchari]MDZ7320766.1 tail fiber protein [Kosakonia sacchari]
MEQLFFRVPFASGGDTTAIPVSVTTDGSVNWPQGWGQDYEKDMDADAHAKAVERDVMNFMFNAVTVALRQYQTAAFPEFITPADNGGSPFPYAAGTVVRFRAGTTESFSNYVSLVDSNTATPGTDATKWQEFIFAEATEAEAKEGISGTKAITPRRLKQVNDDLEQTIINMVSPFILPVGAIILWGGESAPEGWLELNGQEFDVSKNPELASIYPAGRVPDWRGRVPRGWAHGSTVDSEPNRGIGSFQEDAIENITGMMTTDSNAKQATGAFYLGTTVGSQSASGKSTARYVYFDASRVVRTANETRMKNVAAMFIIKTDQSESDNNTNLPTALVPTPATAILEQGKTIKCAAAVLPSSLASSYPVSWAVSDPSLGSIDSTGLYSAVAGVSGTQTVIASISTGLVATITIEQHVFLTKITIGAIHDLTVSDEPYTPSITFTPSNFTEPLEYSSADDSVASFSFGQVYPNSQGTAVISVKGSYSGITGTQMVKVLPEDVVEEYLRVDSYLEEITLAGDDAQQKARTNLGLGDLATKDSLSARDVGAAPMASEPLPHDLDLDVLTAPGDYFQNVSSYATEENHYPEETAGAMRVVATGVSEGACRQFYWPYDSTKEYRRCGYGEPLVFGAWAEY